MKMLEILLTKKVFKEIKFYDQIFIFYGHRMILRNIFWKLLKFKTIFLKSCHAILCLCIVMQKSYIYLKDLKSFILL